MTFVPNRNLINKSLADQSHVHTSWYPEKRSEQEIQGFVEYVQNVYESMQKYAKTDAQKESLDAEMQRYQAGYAQKYNADLAAKGRTFSSMITGGSNFPTRRHEKANQAEQNRYDEMKDWDDRAQASIIRELKKLSIAEAGGEMAVMKQKIADAEEAQENYKKINVILRKKNLSDDAKVQEIIAATGYKESTARNMFKKDFAGRTGIPSYVLTNNLANVHRMKLRLAELEKKESTPTGELVFDGGTIIDNAEADRIQIIYDKIPSEEIRTKLKGSGWKWSPNACAWQRMRTEASRQSAKHITGAVEKKETVQEIKKDVEQGDTITVPEAVLKETIKDNSEILSNETINNLLERIKVAKTKDEVVECGNKLNKHFSEGALALMPPRSVQFEVVEVYNNKLKEFEFKKELAQGETIEIPLKDIPGLMKKGTLPDPDWEFEKQQDERIKREKEREENRDDYYRDYETEKGGWVEDPDEIRQWMNFEAYKELELNKTIEIPKTSLKTQTPSEEKKTEKMVEDYQKELEQLYEEDGRWKLKSGVFIGKTAKRCPECFRGLVKGVCGEHGRIQPEDQLDLRNIGKDTKTTKIAKEQFNDFMEQAKEAGYKTYAEYYKAMPEESSLKQYALLGVGLEKIFDLDKGKTMELPESILKTELKPAKELWEMTYQEFATEFQDKYNDSGYSFAERVGKPLGIESQAGEPLRIINGKKRGYPQSLIRDRWRYVILQDAIDHGKKLSAEVMSDYLENQKNFPILLEGSVNYPTPKALGVLYPLTPHKVKPVIVEVKKEILKGETAVIPEFKLIAGLRPTGKIKRFEKGKDYIGIKYKGKNHLGEWEERMEMTKLHGRPYSAAEWDSIIEYTPKKWAELKELIQKEANVNNRDVREDSLNVTVLQLPRWKSSPKPEKEIKYKDIATVPEAMGLKKDIRSGKTITVPEPQLKPILQPMKNMVAIYRKLAWDAKEKGKYKQAAQFYEIAIKNYELQPQEGELYKSDLESLKKYHAEMLALSKIEIGKTAEVPEATLEPQTQVPTAEGRWRKFSDHKSETKAVKEALSRVGIEAEVGHGRGTGWGWLEINIGDPRPRGGVIEETRQYTQEEQDLHKKVLTIAKEVTGRYGEYDGNISLMAQDWRNKAKSTPSPSPSPPSTDPVKNWLIKSKDGKFTLTLMYSTERDALEYANKTYHGEFSLHESPKKEQYIPKLSDAELEKAREEGKRIRQDLAKGETVKVSESKLVEIKGQAGISDKPPYGKEYPRHRMVRILVETDKNGKEIYYQTIDPMWKRRISIDTVNSLKSEGRAFLTGKGIDAPVIKPLPPLPPKYKVGEMVYSWQNPSVPAEIIRVNLSNELGYSHTYILRLQNKEAGGGSYNSKYINEESLSYSPLIKPHVHDITILPQIEKEVARGEIVVVPQSQLMKRLEAPSVPFLLYSPNPKPLLEKGKTVEISGLNLDEMLQKTKMTIKTKAKAQNMAKTKAKEHQPCTPPVHVHAYRRGCPTKRRK